MSEDLNFNDLGVFSTEELVPKVVTMFDGSEPVQGTVYVRRLSSVEVDRFHQETKDPDVETRIGAIPRFLAKAIRKADGGSHLSVSSARQLTNANRTALLKAATEVNKETPGDDLGN